MYRSEVEVTRKCLKPAMEAADVHVCRTCTSRERRINMKSILTDQLVIHTYKTQMSIIDAFNEITKMVVDENETLTTLICVNCVRRLRQAILFRMTAVRSYENLTKSTSPNFYTEPYALGGATSFGGLRLPIKCERYEEEGEQETFFEGGIIEESNDYQEELACDNLDVKEERPDLDEALLQPKIEVEIKTEARRDRRRARIVLLEEEPRYKPRTKRYEEGAALRPSKPKKETYYCDLCPATFNNKRFTFLHMKKLHMSKKPYKCWIEGCGKLYVSPAQRRFHQEAIHYKIKRHVCDICGLCFTDNPKLQSHRRVHTGEILR